MRILYFNNCWFTNVGEAFIDIGGMHLIKKVFPDSAVACLSAMTDYYVLPKQVNKKRLLGRNHNKELITCKMDGFLEADYVVLPGMVATREFLSAKSRYMIDNLVARGCKLIFLGLGGIEYNNEEVLEFSRYLEKIKPALLISRDDATYENYKDVANSVRGIDCAFWCKDVFDARGFNNSIYDIVSFNRTEEPAIFSEWLNPVIRPWHMQYSYRKSNYKDNILLSDSPYDYLTVYANANKVYTDLVHATIISLMYGRPVKYWYFDERSQAFSAVKGLKIDSDDFLSVKEEDLEIQKNNIISKIKSEL